MDKYTAYVTDMTDDIVFMESDLNFIIPMAYKQLCEFLNSRDGNEKIGILLMKVPKGGKTNEILYNHNLQNCVTVKEAKDFLKNYKR